MTRKSLRPQLNQIRSWVQQGRTDAWIAHQLEVTVQQIETFKRQHHLSASEDEAAASSFEEVDLRAEDDAAIAESLEAAELEAEKARAEEAKRAEEERKAQAERKAARDAEDSDSGDEKKPRRSRSTRTRRRVGTKTFEGTFDHGDEGYGLWLDPAVADSPIYAEHWAGHRPVEVTVEEDQIIIRRANSGGDEADSST